MLFLKGHGKQAQLNAGAGASGPSAAAACGFDTSAPEMASPSMMETSLGRFGYMFPDAPEVSHDAHKTHALDALADAMIDAGPAFQDNSELPAIFTYLGQFIDHDITAGTDRETDFSTVDVEEVVPKPRAEVVDNVLNLRTGNLDLDSIYGGAAIMGPFAKKMQDALRAPFDRSKLFLGVDQDEDVDGETIDRPPLPDDLAGDLLRFGRLRREHDPIITDEDLKLIPDDLKELFLDDAGNDQRSRAVIADARNDENLAVATVHFNMLRFHNKIVDAAHKFGGPVGDNDKLFAWAQTQVRLWYQWMVINIYLRKICDNDVLDDVLTSEAPIYKDFLTQMGGAKNGNMPMPLEFSVAAFRFGHTMARPTYDWNRFFGRQVPGDDNILTQADFHLMFAFTGNGKPPMFGRTERLPSNWIGEMDRFLNVAEPTQPDRNTRKIDTHIAPPLFGMGNEEAGLHEVLKILPRRNLRRGHLLNLPSAQACLEKFGHHGIHLQALTEDQLRTGSTGGHVEAGGFVAETPLWFYVLKEAEILGGGECLGPLGSRIVAETLAGLIIHGSDTYWSVPGSDHGRWQPSDGVRPKDNEAVDDLEAFMRATLML